MTRHGNRERNNYTVLLYSTCLDRDVWSVRNLQLIGWELFLQCRFLHAYSEVFISRIHYCWQTWILGFSEILSSCQYDLLWSFLILPEWLPGHKPYSSLHRMWAIIDLTKDMHMYSFICGKEVSFDERKIAYLQRISCFKLAMSDPVWHFIMGYLNMFIKYAVRLHSTMYVL